MYLVFFGFYLFGFVVNLIVSWLLFDYVVYYCCV